PCGVEQLRASHPDATLVGVEAGYFACCVANANYLPEAEPDQQYVRDIRNVPDHVLEAADGVFKLAAAANDPRGNKYEDATLDINHQSGIKLAKRAKDVGVRSFIFASSCSMYDAASDAPKKEDSELNPLTAYARSKVFTERDLQPLADENFVVTCLRFATAC